MATAKVKQFWTAFISVLFALLASLGLATPAAAAPQPALQQGEEPALAGGTGTAAERPAVSVPAQRSHQWRAARSNALPPTIKQRIGAEAHGSSPAVRHLRDAAAQSGADAAAPADELAGAALSAPAMPSAPSAPSVNVARATRVAQAA
ncbi:DUF6344 domain-containing protein [Streptomyces sp. NPDC048659]|uniref:DUF6344 domain-containing protein n=1 Tax=Streptomyces sp. NPDC048659 TaxID=3155489 RepID=UPI00344AE1F9